MSAPLAAGVSLASEPLTAPHRGSIPAAFKAIGIFSTAARRVRAAQLFPRLYSGSVIILGLILLIAFKAPCGLAPGHILDRL